MTMSCDFEKAKLTAYFDGEIDDAGRADVEAHIASCSACLRELGEVKSASESVRRLDRRAVPGAVTDAILRGVREERPASPFLTLPRVLAAAAAVLVAVVVFVVVSRQPQPADAPLALEKSVPDKLEEAAPPAAPAEREFVGKDGAFRKEAAPAPAAEPEVVAKGAPKRRKAPPAPVDVVTYTIRAEDVAQARGRVEQVLAKNLARSNVGTGDANESHHELDNCVYVDVTEDQLAQIQRDLRKGGIALLPAAAPETAKQELAKDEGKSAGKPEAAKEGLAKDAKKPAAEKEKADRAEEEQALDDLQHRQRTAAPAAPGRGTGGAAPQPNAGAAPEARKSKKAGARRDLGKFAGRETKAQQGQKKQEPVRRYRLVLRFLEQPAAAPAEKKADE
ncbi:MAG: anti-sigma factor family protein [Planctomycetota bacterium]|jgi:hypothetical protein